jgi:hypothetical protein
MMKCVVAILCFVATWQAAYAAQPEHSKSPSRQFVIYGADAKVRGAISGLAEQTKTDLLGLLRQRDNSQISPNFRRLICDSVRPVSASSCNST